jgi:hypothetical protein
VREPIVSEPSTCLCGAELPRRATGRPALHCSTRCRQSANRAKQRARNGAEHAGRLRAGSARDVEQLQRLVFELDGLVDKPIGAADKEQALLSLTGAQAWQIAPPTGWEEQVAEVASRLARIADGIAEAARAHARATVEHGQALTAAGIPQVEPSATVETGSVASTTAAAATTKPATGSGDGEADHDAVPSVAELAAATGVFSRT